MNSEGDFTLILAEKPDAARRIAAALAEKVLWSPNKGGLPLYEIVRSGRRIKVMAALGHLYTLKQSGKGWDYPVHHMEWIPRFKVDKSARNTEPLLAKFRELSIEAEALIVATDYDVEGETIAYCILKYACSNDALNKAQRMRFSTLTDRELVQAYERPLAHLDFGMAEAGETRHKLDWLFGINISRALILAVKHATGRYNALSAGRVQGPTLAFIADREIAIRSFVPTPYWTIDAKAKIGGKDYSLEHRREKISSESEADEIIRNCSSQKGIIVEITRKEAENGPPYPFDLGSLQSEAYRLFGYTPTRTLSIAERLYLAAFISYPRTGSQKIPASFNPKAVLEPLARIPRYRTLAAELLNKDRLTPNQGEKDDPAHPPITPTETLPPAGGLTEPENKIYDLIVRRFMSIYGDPATIESVKATVEIDGEIFYLRGRRILKEGWLKFYAHYVRTEEVLLPEIRKGQVIENIKVSSQEKYTGPSPRYNPSTLLRLMEEQEIGTKATRAEIIDTLGRRGYVSGERITITDLGFAVVDVLRKYSPRILSVEMTRQLEKDMERIQVGQSRESEVLSEAMDFLEPILLEFKATETAIGVALDEALRRSLRKLRTVGPCPVCKTGDLIVIRSRKTGKRFIGCTNYRDGQCKFSAPLPQFGTLQLTEKRCSMCGFPVVILRTRGRRPWQLCVNMNCEKNTKYKTQKGSSEQRSSA